MSEEMNFNPYRCKSHETAISEIKKALEQLVKVVSDQRAMQEQIVTLFNRLGEIKSDISKIREQLVDVEVSHAAGKEGQTYIKDLVFLILGIVAGLAMAYLKMR